MTSFNLAPNEDGGKQEGEFWEQGVLATTEQQRVNAKGSVAQLPPRGKLSESEVEPGSDNLQSSLVFCKKNDRNWTKCA